MFCFCIARTRLFGASLHTKLKECEAKRYIRSCGWLAGCGCFGGIGRNVWGGVINSCCKRQKMQLVNLLCIIICGWS